VEWEEYLDGLTETDRQRAADLAREYGQEAASHYVRYHLVLSPDELEDGLKRDRRRVRTQVRGLYESIDVDRCPTDWTITNAIQTTDGTRVVRTDVTGPNGAKGFFVRGFNPAQQRVELREALLRLEELTEAIPSWVRYRSASA
jgi:hypothetical protein